MQLSEEQIDAIIDSVATYGDNGGREYPPFAVARAVEAALRAQADARPIGKVLSEEEMGIGYDRRTGPVLWFGTPKPGLIYTHPEASAPGLSDAEDLADVVSKAIRRAWQLGQTYWQQADSEYISQNRKSDATQAAYQTLVDETRIAILTRASAATVAEPPAAFVTHCEELVKQMGYSGIGQALNDLHATKSAQQQAEPHTSQAHPTFQTVSVPNGPGTPSAQTFDRRIACKPGQPEWKSCKQQAEPGADERAAIEAIARLDETYYHQWVKNPLGYVSGNVPINDIVAVIEWARAAQSGQRAGVAEGWRFYSADFSITAHQPSQPGYVMLIRDEIGYKKWHRMDEAAKEEIPLFVTGRGVTFEKALLHANENAMLAAAPTQQQDNQS